MTKTVTDIENEIKALEAEKKKVLRDTRKEIIKDIIKTISQYEITVNELFKTETQKKDDSIKYVHPQDNTKVWPGRGAKPKWLKELVAAGTTLESLKVEKATIVIERT